MRIPTVTDRISNIYKLPYLDKEVEDKLVKKIEEEAEAMAEKAEEDYTGLSFEEKEKVNNEVNERYGALKNEIEDIVFDSYLTRDEYRALRKWVLSECEYDMNKVFIGYKIKETWLDQVGKYESKEGNKKIDIPKSTVVSFLNITEKITFKDLENSKTNFMSTAVIKLYAMGMKVSQLEQLLATVSSEINKIIPKLDSVSPDEITEKTQNYQPE